jgi:hypothetical protein
MEGVQFQDEVGQVECDLNVRDIQEQAVDFFGAVEGDPIEYYDGTAWHPLTSEHETTLLPLYASSGQMCPCGFPTCTTNRIIPTCKTICTIHWE